ncbi:MAG: hypothetical protein CVU50_00185 [Candidatus Cloacimonetes bacterium HGW-Cloacimonetes-3]|jgi:hypothetical protein|nr:MAG: hypothetical protein CVU50_00185 [Candidatus Cloacimonetes bacterium HGW-Cloacimonetes-3]
MKFRQENRIKQIKEFIDLVENHKIDLRHYKSPVLVWAIQEGTVYYSFWEEDLLMRFGVENVDGWDYEEDQLFCPDWIADPDDDDDDDLDDDDDDDLGLICNIKFDRKP